MQVVGRELGRLGIRRSADPIGDLTGALNRTAGIVAVLEGLVADLEPGYREGGLGWAGPDHLGDARPHVFLALLKEWTETQVRVAKTASEIGVDELRRRWLESAADALRGLVEVTIAATVAEGADAGRAAARKELLRIGAEQKARAA
jgi:hypothetical protein